MKDVEDFALRRTFQPYVAEFIIFCAITGLLTFDFFRTHDMSWIVLVVLLWAVAIATQYPNARYRIFWEGGKIKQVAVYGDPTVIEPSEINKIAEERSDQGVRPWTLDRGLIGPKTRGCRTKEFSRTSPLRCTFKKRDNY
jgi:hypothetical protein